MKRQFCFWSFILIGCLVLTGLCIRSLALQNISYYQSLYSRGFICLILTFLYGSMKGYSLFPKRLGVQFSRAIVAGLALTFFTLSYRWLTASSISLLSNVDVPLLIALGPMIGTKSFYRTRVMALVAISLLVFYVLSLEDQPNLYLGVLTLGVGSILLCFGYLFIKKSMSEENEAVTIAVPSVAIIIYGLLQSLLHAAEPVGWPPGAIVPTVFAGVGMFGAYIATMKLYSFTDIASAEFPGLLSAIVIQPLEAIFLGSQLRFTYLFSSIVFVGVIYLILQWQKRYEVLEARGSC